MKIHYITVEEYIKRHPKPKSCLKPSKDIAQLIQVSKDATLSYDPKNIAEALVLINSIGINKIIDYLDK